MGVTTAAVYLDSCIAMEILAAAIDVPVEMGEPEGRLVGARWYGSVDQAVAGMYERGVVVGSKQGAVEAR